MKKQIKKFTTKSFSVALCIVLLITMLIPGLTSFSVDVTIEITKNGSIVTEKIEVQEYRSEQLGYSLSVTAPEGSYVTWESNLPLLAGVDDAGKVTGYDYSKAAIIQLWIDEEVRSMPVVGEAMASAIESALASSGIDLETANTDVIVAIVSGINADLGESLRKRLDNMNVEITARIFDADGNELSSDSIEVLVTQSLIASVAPTGVHITNKKSVPTVVAVGTQVQLYGACTPVRLKQGIKWSMGRSAFDSNSSKYATVSADGLVTFTSVGEATVRVNPESTLYAAFSDSITFTIVNPSELPITDFSISGTTEIKEGESTQLSIDNLVPAGAYTGSIQWSSSDSAIATVDQNGVVTGLDGGSGLTFSKTATITASVGEVSRSVTVTVKRNTSTSISGVDIDGDTAVGIGTSTAYTSTVLPTRLNSNKDAVKKWGLIDPVTGNVIYAASGAPATDGISSITTEGILTGVSDGTSTIYIEVTYNDKTVTNTYIVTVGTAITDFTINGTAEINEGDSTTLTISGVTPSNAVYDKVIWSSADATIASVDKNGVVKGLDAGGNYNLFNNPSQSTTITATINGISRSFTIKVKAKIGLNAYTGGEIIGPDNLVVDFPYTYTSIHTPERMSINKQTWGTDANISTTSNEFVSIDTSSGKAIGHTAGTTTIYTYMQNNIVGSSKQTLSKNINVVELTPKSITITVPAKYEYLEGETELDLTGMTVKLNYDKDELAQYYPEASGYTEEQMTVTVTDYKVSAINPTLLDNEQYIVVTVTRAGKDMRAIFPILVKSKQVDTIDILQNPRYQYLEGETELDLAGLSVRANYLNAASEEVTDFTVNTGDFNPTLLNVEQNITVTYLHAGRSASATFPVIIYGIPVVTVSTGDYAGGWSKDDVTFTLDSTHQIDGITYYYKTAADNSWKAITGNTLTVDTNIDETYYFKAINGKNIESSETVGYRVSIDKISPVFTLEPTVTDITNQSYDVNINIGVSGASGIGTITLNDNDITGNTSFTVSENGIYTVKITSVSGLVGEQQIAINNIDKTAPAILDIALEHKNTGNFARFVNSMTFGLFFKETVEATITAEDYGVAGIDFIEYRYLDENGDPISDWAIYDESNKPSQDLNFKGYIEARATDKATNVSETKYSVGYVIDSIAPTDITVSATDSDGLYVSDTWTDKDVTITLSSTAFSDIYKYYYRIDGGEWVELDGDTFTTTTHGITNYEFKAVSYSDLESSITPFVVKIDKIQPVIRVDFEGTFGRWTSGDVKFKFSTLQDAISGVTYYYNNGNGWVEITTGKEILLNENVNASYMFKAVNGAGVESNPSDSYKVMIDNTVPTVVFTPGKTDITTEPYKVGFTVTAGPSGLKSVSVNGVDVTGQSEITVNENGKYVFVMIGNNDITSTEVLTVDNFISYEIKVTDISFIGTLENQINENFGKYYNSSVSISISAMCNDGTIGQIKYRTLDDSGNPTADWQVYNDSSKPTISPNFKGSVEAQAFDTTGKKSSEIVKSDTITVDNIKPTAPIIEATVNGEAYAGAWTSEDVDVTLSSTAYSGILTYYYKIDNGEWVELASNTITLTDVGEHTYCFKAKSKANLESDSALLSVKYENAIPALSVAVDGTVNHRTSDDVTFTLSAPNTLSGVEYYYNFGNGWVKLDGDTLTVDSTSDTTYYFKAKNGAGVESYQSPAYRVIVDKDYLTVEKKPILNVSVSGTTNEYTANGVVFTLSASECEGNVTYYYNTGDGWTQINGATLTVSSIGDTTYKFKAVDDTGRESLESAEYNTKIDTVSPSVSVKIDSTAFTNTDRTATITASAGASGVKAVTVNGIDVTDTLSFTVSENGKYTVTVFSNNGLSATTVLTVTNFDYIVPLVTDISMEHKNTGGFAKFINKVTFGLFFNEITEFTITAQDTGASGLNRIEYRLLDESGAAATEWMTYNEDNKPTVDSQFRGFAEARAVDNAGNTSPTVTSQGFTVDLDRPTDISITAAVNGDEYDGKFTSQPVTLTPSAAAFSNIHSYMYKIDNGEWNVMTTESIEAIDGVHEYFFKAVSNAANESDVVSIITKVETGTPTLTVDTVGDLGAWSGNNVVFNLSATNVNSGVTYYYNDGNGWVKMNSNVLTVSENTNATYTFKAVNGAGTESAVSEEFVVMVDKTVPEIQVKPNTLDFTNEDVTLNIDISNTGICGVTNVTVNGEAFDSDEFIASENGTYVFEVTLNNGNKASQTVEIANIDKEAPIINSIDLGTPNNIIENVHIFNNEVTVFIDAEDKGTSHIAKIEYREINENSLLPAFVIEGAWKDYDENDKSILQDNFKGVVEVRVTDNAGNVSEISTSVNVLIDTESPTLNIKTDYDNEWTNANVIFTLIGKADSDISQYMYKVDSDEWAELNGNVITAENDGTYTYCFKAVSNSGLESEIQKITVKIEKGTPELTVKATDNIGAWTNDDVTFTLSATNINSGVTYNYDNGDGWTEIDGDVFTISKNTNGKYTFKAVNGAGTESDASKEYIVMLDNVAPERFNVTATSDGKKVKDGKIYTKEITVNLSANSLSGIDKYQYSLNGKDWVDLEGDTLTVKDDGFYNYSFRAVSKSGAISEFEQLAFTINKNYKQNLVTNVDIPNTEVVTMSLLPLSLIAVAIILKKKKNK